MDEFRIRVIFTGNGVEDFLEEFNDFVDTLNARPSILAVDFSDTDTEKASVDVLMVTQDQTDAFRTLLSIEGAYVDQKPPGPPSPPSPSGAAYITPSKS